MTTLKPNQLEVGDCFSYPGSFKIYKVVTPPEIDPEFASLRPCPTCEQPAYPPARLKFRVTDEGTQGEIGIRLRADVACTIHTLDELLDQALKSAARRDA